MKKICIKILCACILLSCLINLLSCGTNKSNECIDSIEYTELGNPSSERYLVGIRARCPWDMILWDNMLYIGSGDYDTNRGPIDIWRYNIQQGTWENSGAVPDEEVNRFCIINNSLVIPGTDPREDWDFGNYYMLENGEWKTVRSLPGGIHNFDMVEYNGKIFAGLGVNEGEYPIACSIDGGKTFEQVEMHKNGTAVDTSGGEFIRVYDLFVYNNQLYALFSYKGDETSLDLYRYDNGVFVFDNQWYQKIHQKRYIGNIIGAKTEFKGKMFFTTGYLYATSDMADLTHIKFPNSEIVYDLYVDNDCLYALCGQRQSDGNYKISVWRNDGGEATDFIEIFNFIYSVPPISMVCSNGKFYIGIGGYTFENDKNGMILFIDYISDKKGR